MAQDITVKQKVENSEGLSFLKTIQAEGSPFSRATAGVLFDIDVSNAGGLTTAIGGTFTGQALVMEGSLDGTAWIPINGSNVLNSDTRNYATVISITGSVQEWDVSRFLRFRARLSAIASGSMIINATITEQRPFISNGTFGTVPDDTFIAAPPIVTGARAQNVHSAASSNNDAVYSIATLDRKQVGIPYAIPELSWQYAAVTGGIINTTPIVLKAATASQRTYVTGIQIKTGALSADTEFALSDGATVIYRTILKTGENNVSISFNVPLRCSVNTALNAAILTASTGGVFLNAQGYTAN